MTTLETDHARPDGEDLRPFWPQWGPSRGLDTLASYVSVLALTGTGLGGGDRAPDDDAVPDRAVVESLYAKLAAREVRYALDPALPPQHELQQVRDPKWIVDDRVATCLDLALVFAAMCFDGHVQPMLALPSGHGHALVVLRPDRQRRGKRRAAPPAGTVADAGGPAVYRIDDPAAVADAVERGELLPVECTGVTTDRGWSFDEAVARGAEQLRRDMLLVDVVPAQAGGIEPLPTPRRPALAAYAVRGRRPVKLYRSQRRLLAELAGRTGTVVIHAERGQGKSTVAQELAHRAEHGAGWFLDASEQKRLIESLGDAELAQRGLSADALTRMSREEFAESALARLRETSQPYCVVLDNADGDPSELGRWRLRPGVGQLVVITTTNPDWLEHPDVEGLRLGPIDDDEVDERLPDDRLGDLVGGRALLVEAFERFLGAGAAADDLLHELDVSVPPEVRGPRALYEAIVRREPAAAAAARVAALLPYDRIPADLLARLAQVPHTVVDTLRERGLLTQTGTGEFLQMHRLMSEAVRADDEHDVLQALAAVTGDDEACALVDRWADVEAIKRLFELSVRADDREPDHEHGLRLHRLGWVLEFKGQVTLSAALFERALRHLDDEDDARAVADCKLGIARERHQFNKKDRAKLEEGLRLAEEAEAAVARIEGPVAAGRFLAMSGLIRRALSNVKGTPDEVAHAGLLEALAILELADERRQQAEADDAERLRSRFNLAGTYLGLAKRDRAKAADYLENADEVYRTVLDGRLTLYGRRVHPHVAACIHGRGLIAYYQALLVDHDAAVRTQRLRDATTDVLEGLRIRQELAGDVESKDVHKSTALLAKVALARHALPPTSHADWEDDLEDALIEIREQELHAS